jgi:beta-hydroxylase
MRAHLGLKVPEENEKCRIRVGDDVRHWEEGEVMLFDDTHEHEVWNDTDETRVVLFLDVVRPFEPPVDTLNELLITLISYSPFVQNAKENQEQWEKRMEEAVA